MQTVTKKNKVYWMFDNNPFQMFLVGKSGVGKDLSGEFIIEEWRKKFKGVVIIPEDAKDEGEYTFVQYKPEEKYQFSDYQLKQLSKDGMQPEAHSCKIYHPLTMNIQKGFLPQVNFFSIPIKSMNKEEWSILTESSWDSETIKLMIRVEEDLGREKGIFSFLHEIERLTKGKKVKSLSMGDPKNWRLHSGGGTAKDVAQVGNLLAPFKKDYFLRKDTCPYKLNWKEILTDSQNYHVFLSCWLGEGTRKKLKGFLTLYLLDKIIENRKYLKKPLLLVLPEIKAMCPKNAKGYKYFLADAISEKLVTIRSMGRGMFSISNSQYWGDTDDRVKGSMTETLFSSLSPKDQEIVCKSLSYGKEERDMLKEMDKRFSTFFRHQSEDEGTFRIPMPRHMHRERQYNWIEMYRDHFPEKMKRYDELVEELKADFDREDKEIEEIQKNEEEQEKIERERKQKQKEAKKEIKEKPKKEKIDELLGAKKKFCYEKYQELISNGQKRVWRPISRMVQESFNDSKFSHKTAKKYVEEYKKEIEELKNIPNIVPIATSEEPTDQIGNLE